MDLDALLLVAVLLQEDNLVIYNGGGLIWLQVANLVLVIVHPDALDQIVTQDATQDARDAVVHV